VAQLPVLELSMPRQSPQIQPDTPDPANSANLQRDPEDRSSEGERSVREKMMDKTLADSYPCSDAPSTMPDPGADDSMTHR
jgi:hypothetical protein